MRQFSGRSLKIKLYLLVLISFIPVIVLIFYLAEEQKKIETDDILQKAIIVARATADEEDQNLDAARNLLTAVAAAFQAVDGHPEKLSVIFDDILNQAAGYLDLGIIDAKGHLLSGGKLPGDDRRYADKSWLFSSLQSKQLSMGQYRGEHINGQPVLYFALPVFDLRQHIMAVAFAALNLNWMNQPVFSQLSQLPKDSRLTLLETDQGVLRYDANSRQWSIPEAFDPELRSAIFARRSGILSAPDEDKILRIYAFAPIASALRKRDTMVVLEIPQKVALAASRRVFTRNVILVAASALIAILSIWWASNALILRRVQAMVQVSHKLSAGDLSARIGQIGGQDELSHLARVFDEMAASIQQRIEREASVTASLERSHEQLRRLSAYQQEVRELERTRIAREIHDQFGQSLTILKMDLSRLKKQLPAHLSAVNEKIEAMARVIDDAIQILHTVTADLRPVILDDFGLAAAIEWQAELFQQRTGIGCRLENNGFEPELPKDQATALFRIFQECLTNVVRHAQADDVVVRLEARPGELMLQIKDNGRGITNAEINAPDAFGLLGIRERLYPWNGRTTFSGRPGQGTQVTIYLPMLPEGGSQ